MARNGLELAARCLWILLPDEPFEREVRFLAHMKTEEDELV